MIRSSSIFIALFLFIVVASSDRFEHRSSFLINLDSALASYYTDNSSDSHYNPDFRLKKQEIDIFYGVHHSQFCQHFQDSFATENTDPRQGIYVESEQGEAVSLRTRSMSCICELFQEDSAFAVYSVIFGKLGEEFLQPAQSCSARSSMEDEYLVIVRKESLLDKRIHFLMNFIKISLPNGNFIADKKGVPMFLFNHDPQILILEPQAAMDDEHWSLKYENLLSKEGGDFLEFGAHNGMNVVKLWEFTEEGAELHTFEPSPTMKRIAELHKFLFHLDNIFIHEDCLHQIGGITVPFEASLNVNSSVINEGVEVNSSKIIEVETTTLDEYIFGKGSGRNYAGVRLDIEGSEFGALLSSLKYLSSVKGAFINVEFHGYHVPSYTKQIRQLQRLFESGELLAFNGIECTPVPFSSSFNLQIWNTVVVHRNNLDHFLTHTCPLMSQKAPQPKRKLPEPETFIRMPNGFYSIGNDRFNENHRLLGTVEATKGHFETCVFVEVSDHLVLTSAISQLKCSSVVLVGDEIDYAKFTLFIVNSEIDLEENPAYIGENWGKTIAFVESGESGHKFVRMLAIHDNVTIILGDDCEETKAEL